MRDNHGLLGLYNVQNFETRTVLYPHQHIHHLPFSCDVLPVMSTNADVAHTAESFRGEIQQVQMSLHALSAQMERITIADKRYKMRCAQRARHQKAVEKERQEEPISREPFRHDPFRLDQYARPVISFFAYKCLLDDHDH